MKKFTLIISLFFPVVLFAQYSPQEIKKYKISKLIKLSANADSSETWNQTILYDRSGNDTAVYMGDSLYMRFVYEFNSKEKIAKKVTYKYDRSEVETAEYIYKPDGSYTISNKDKSYGMTDYTYYDKTGKVTKTQSPDGAQRIYTYDAKGKLLGIKSKPGGDGVLTDIKYTYNDKGQCTKEVSKGEYKWTTSNTYDSKGLLIRSITISTDGEEQTKTSNSYKYEFWK
ncbi:MAG: hypothetical protein JJE22_12105 [Bacteroidia bacterium]|nr:hypothetical protein [Bacteroidia bacterium]